MTGNRRWEDQIEAFVVVQATNLNVKSISRNVSLAMVNGNRKLRVTPMFMSK